MVATAHRRVGHDARPGEPARAAAPLRVERTAPRLLNFPYRWAWGQKLHWGPTRRGARGTPPRVFDRERRGERCRVLARGTMNSGLLEFEDGYRVVTSRSGLRRAAA